MSYRFFNTLVPIIIIVTLSFAVALGLFKLMESSATVTSNWYQLGGGIAGFVVIFWLLRSWYDHRETQNSEDLAIEIARLSAANIIRESGNDTVALKTGYNDLKNQLRDHFKRQDKNWLNILFEELRNETILQAREQYPELRNWEPEEIEIETVIEDI
ncbi:MAG: hypothetical protein PHH93_07100 [Prolixibacteraceae bacterium]|nr:hypothetical protein [Prolixibacteraceae bacterium]